MSLHKDTVYLRHIHNYAKEVEQIVQNKIRNDLDCDAVLRYALLHLICIMGEAANRISPEGHSKFPEVPWRGIISMRNMVIHGYDVVDVDILWDTVIQDIPELIRILGKLPLADKQ
jgi:uncharacterized protein with HEPN domain